MNVINRLSSSPVTSSRVSFAKYTHSEFKFKAGSFKLNGVKITFKIGDTLDTIVKKFNDKKLLTGVSAKKIYLKDNRTYKIILISSRLAINILDIDGVLSDLYKKKLFGSDNKCLLQVTRSEAGKKISDITINYTLKQTQQVKGNTLLEEFQKFQLAEKEKNKDEEMAQEEINELAGVTELFNEV